MIKKNSKERWFILSDTARGDSLQTMSIYTIKLHTAARLPPDMGIPII